MARKWKGIRFTDAQLLQIRTAARASGVSVNAFVLDAALNAAEVKLENAAAVKLEKRQPESVASLLHAASFGGGKESRTGYLKAGSEFVIHAKRLIGKGPGTSAKLSELNRLLAELRLAGSKRDYQPLLDWFKRYLPNEWKSIPSRRRERFAKGICEAYDGGYTKLKR
jgi:hypothetical protein